MSLSHSALSLRSTRCRSCMLWLSWRATFKPFCRPSSTASSSIKLRPYQEESISAVLSYLEKGERRLGLSLATGAGKTVIFSQLIGRVSPPTHSATKTLILVHRRELVEQAARHCTNAYPGKIVEVDMGNIHASGKADITVASVMSLVRGDRLLKYDPANYKLVLVDEAHHIVASAYLHVLEYFRLLRKVSGHTDSSPSRTASVAPSELQSAPALVGVSATFSRFDGLSLGHAIDHIVYHKDYIDLIGENWLSDVVFTTVNSGADLSRVKSHTDGDFLPSSLSHAVNTEITNEITVRAWLTKAEGRKSTLGFCVDVAHVEGLTAKFRSLGVDARYVTGKTGPSQRSVLVDQFKNGKFPVLLNVGVFTEGTDIPNIDCVLLARPTKSRNLLVQMIGRGMRLYEGKENCHVIDMVSSLRTGILTTPSLFGLDPTVLLDNAKVSDVERQKHLPFDQRQYIDGVLPDRYQYALDSGNRDVTFKDYKSVSDLISDTSDEKHIHTISKNAWIQVGPDAEGHNRYVLNGAGSAYLTIKDLRPSEASQFEVRLTSRVPRDPDEAEKKPWQPFRRPQLIARSATFADAVHAADTFTGTSGHFPRTLIERRQAWRQRPATQSQVEFLVKFRPKDSDWDPSEYTNGKCAEMITKIKFGAKGQFNALEAERGRQSRREEKFKKEEELRKRELVKVGPLSQNSFS